MDKEEIIKDMIKSIKDDTMSEEEKIWHIKKRIENLKQGIGIMQINGITQQNWASDYEYLIDLYQQEKENNKQVTKIANEYKSWWINLGNEIKHIRDKAELMDYYGLVDVIKDLNKLIGDKEDE